MSDYEMLAEARHEDTAREEGWRAGSIFYSVAANARDVRRLFTVNHERRLTREEMAYIKDAIAHLKGALEANQRRREKVV